MASAGRGARYMYIRFSKVICPGSGQVRIKKCKLFIRCKLWKVHQSENEWAPTWSEGATADVARVNNFTEVNNINTIIGAGEDTQKYKVN